MRHRSRAFGGSIHEAGGAILHLAYPVEITRSAAAVLDHGEMPGWERFVSFCVPALEEAGELFYSGSDL